MSDNHLRTDMVVVIALAIALYMAIYYHMTELATAIAGGLVGYIGNSAVKGGGMK